MSTQFALGSGGLHAGRNSQECSIFNVLRGICNRSTPLLAVVALLQTIDPPWSRSVHPSGGPAVVQYGALRTLTISPKGHSSSGRNIRTSSCTAHGPKASCRPSDSLVQ